MLKKAAFSPTQPRRTKTRRSVGKAAASEEARRTLRYVEHLSEARTKHGEWRVSARRGWAGEKERLFQHPAR